MKGVLSATWKLDRGSPAGLAHAWVLNQYPSDRYGHAVSIPCPGVHLAGKPQLVAPKCLARHTPEYMHAVFHPASQFWALQAIETGIFAGAALVLIAFAACWMHERAT